MRSSLVFFTLLCRAWARSLSASSLVTCMDNSQLDGEQFEVEFDPDDGSLHYTLNLNNEVSGYVLADVQVYAYGFKIIEETVNFCDVGWKQFCPLYPGNIDIDSIEYISSSLVDMIPGIAYTVPDIDAIARVIVKDYNGTEVACIQASFTNGKTVSHTAARWATAVVAGLGLLASAMLSAFGNSNSASHISANAGSLFAYFQSVVIVSMEHVQEVPPIAAAWAENLSWSMGLIRVEFMQEVFRWYVQATGGTPSLYLTSETIAILVQRSWNLTRRALGMPYDESFLQKRDSPIYSLEANSNLLIFRGIKRVAYKAGIENTSVCCTGFTFFVLCAYFLIGFFFVFKSSLAFLIKLGWIKPTTALEFRNHWRLILKGVLQRYIYIGFPQLIILSFWQFTERDSPAVIVLAVIFMLFSLGIMAWSCYRTLKFGKLSIQLHQNPAAILYGDSRILNKYGWFYTMFNAKKYWWGAVILVHMTIKAVFVSFAQASGKTQAFVIFVLDLAYTIFLILEKPYLDRPTNIINILIAVVILVNSFLFTFFSNLYGQPAAVASIMGWVFFVLNAAFSLILLLLVLAYAAVAIFSKNPDARFAPAKDDRTSFQKNKSLDDQDAKQHYDENTDELFALGITAKDHHENWAGEMHKLRDYVESSSTSQENDHKEDTTTDAPDESLGSRLVHKLTRGKSLNRNRSLLRRKNTSNKDSAAAATGGAAEATGTASGAGAAEETFNVKRVSDTLLSPPPQATSHQRTESKTPMIQQDNSFNLGSGNGANDAASISTAGISHYGDAVENANSSDFNFKNLNATNQPYKFHDSPRKSLSTSMSNLESYEKDAKRGSIDFDS